ncbi:hypothetical protein [cf. Phormidesmis sp. LEGE 11477]|uniref:hypothetical protein n=1 Tax=cf. Phormidesmis sp. LEGE 11477 TaxID=1828680 RepID=UPI00187F84B7|nr:hypothetical protein [cf. Phormidesmis sp. LEGE 11477]
MTSTAFSENLQQPKQMNRRTQKGLSAHDVHQRRWASLRIGGGGAIICILPFEATGIFGFFTNGLDACSTRAWQVFFAL